MCYVCGSERSPQTSQWQTRKIRQAARVCLAPCTGALSLSSVGLIRLPSELRNWDYKSGLIINHCFSFVSIKKQYFPDFSGNISLPLGVQLHHLLLKWDITVYLNQLIFKTRKFIQWNTGIISQLSFSSVKGLQVPKARQKGSKLCHPKISHFGMLIILNSSYLRNNRYRRTLWPSFVPLKAKNKSPLWKVGTCPSRFTDILLADREFRAEKAG